MAAAAAAWRGLIPGPLPQGRMPHAHGSLGLCAAAAGGGGVAAGVARLLLLQVLCTGPRGPATDLPQPCKQGDNAREGNMRHNRDEGLPDDAFRHCMTPRGIFVQCTMISEQTKATVQSSLQTLKETQ
jgi:hypothetical protein